MSGTYNSKNSEVGLSPDDFDLSTPERKLWLEVIMRALRDYTDPDCICKNQEPAFTWRTARGFLFSTKRDERSLYWVLEHISNDPEGLAKKIRLEAKKAYEGKNYSRFKLYSDER